MKRTLPTLLLLPLWLLAAWLPLPSAAQTCGWVRMGIADGLPNEQTRQVIRLADDRMLVMSEGTFCWYDGNAFRPLDYRRTDALPIESFINTDHYVDLRQRLWVKSNHQLFCIDTRTLRFLSPRQLLSDSGVEQPLQNFFIDADGAAWLHTDDNALYRYDWQGKARFVMRIAHKEPGGTVAKVCDVVQAGSQHYILLSAGVMIRWDAKRGRTLDEQQICVPWSGFRLKGLAWNPHTLLLRTHEGLIRHDTEDGTDSLLLADQNIYEFRGTEAQGLWVSGKTRLWQFDARLRLVQTIDSVAAVSAGPFYTGPWQGLATDWQGGLWVCSFNDGVFYHHPYGMAATFEPCQRAEAIRRIQHFEPFPTAANDIYTDSRQRTWVSTGDGIIWCYPPDGAPPIRYDRASTPGMWGSIPFCRELNDSCMLTCIRLNHLSLLYPDEHRLVQLPDAYPRLRQFRNMVAIVPINDADGRTSYLIGTQNGFFGFDTRRMEPDFERFRLLNDNPYSDKCNCLYVDKQGIIWIGTQNGLLRYDERAARLHRYSTADGLPGNCIFSIVADEATDDLWMATANGIVRKRGNEFLCLGNGDGVGEHHFLERMATQRGSHLLFAAEDGICSVLPQLAQLPDMPLRPRLMSISVHDSLLSPSDYLHDGDSIYRLSLAYNENFLSLDISALNYAYSHHTRYRYRLHGVDREWQVRNGNDGRVRIAYTSLAPGNYRLEVEAAMQGQAWSRPLVIDIRITPPWWQTWWAYTLYLLSILSLAYYLVRNYLIRRRIRHDIERKEQRIRHLLELVKEREAESEPLTIVADEGDIRLNAADERFLQKAMACVERHISNSQYSVEMFAADMAMERSTLYRRLQSAVGKSPLEFMRTVRLQRAAELLRSGEYQVGEVSDMTGFSNRKNFARYFREAYGVLPSQYK